MDNIRTPYPHIIGLTGKPRAGKSEVASILEREHGYVRLSVADPIRYALEVLDPLIALHPDRHKTPAVRLSKLLEDWDWDWRTLKSKHPEVRRLLQVLGTDVAREMWDEDFWLRTLVERIHQIGNERIVVDDVRFCNEVEAIHDLGGFIVRVCSEARTKRASFPSPWDLADTVPPKHLPLLTPHYERGDLPADLHLPNTFDLDTLTIQVKDVIEDLDLLVAV